MVLHKFGTFTLGLGMMAGLVHATTSYSTLVAFTAAAASAGLTLGPTITFDSDVCSLCVSVSDSGDTFSSTQMNILSPSGWVDGNVLARATVGGSISISPGGSYSAFAFNIVTVSGPAFAVDVVFNDGVAQDFNVTTGGSTGAGVFFGYVSTNPITSLQVLNSPGGLIFGIDDVQIGSQSSTAEGSTVLLIGGGLIVLHLLRRGRARLVRLRG